jgi:acyl carrier protein
MTYVENRVLKIIADILRLDVTSITPESLIQDFGGDETSIAAIIMTMEEEFEITINEGNNKLMKTCQDFIDQVPEEYDE